MNIKPFEEKVLASGLCDIMLPMDFIGVNEDMDITYDASGYRQINDMDLSDFDLVLEILEKTMGNLEKAGEFLLDPGKILLTKITVHQDPRCRDIKIAYNPGGSGNVITNIAGFIEELSLGLDDSAKEKMDEIREYIMENNLSLKDAACHVSKVRRFDKPH